MTAAVTISIETLRQCQAILLPALLGATLEQTATVLGVGRATVTRLQSAFRKNRAALPKGTRNWGGRRQALLTQKEEDEFLKPWLQSAASGSLVVVSPIRAALAQRLRRLSRARARSIVNAVKARSKGETSYVFQRHNLPVGSILHAVIPSGGTFTT